LAFRMFARNTHKSDYLEIIRGSNISIIRESEAAVHVDGEPLIMGKELNITLKSQSLTILH